MRKKICALSQKSAIAIRQIDSDMIAGNFSTVDWVQLSAIATDLERLMFSLGMIAPGESEIVQVLQCVPGITDMIPAVVIYAEQGGDLAVFCEVGVVLEKFAAALKTPTDLSGSRPELPFTNALTQEQLQVIDAAAAECARVLGRSVKHPIRFEAADGAVRAEAEGRLRTPVSHLVAEIAPRAVRAIIDQLGYTNFSVQLIADSGDRIDGNYENHDEFGFLADLLRSRRQHEFCIISRSDDRGKIRHIVVPISTRGQ